MRFIDLYCGAGGMSLGMVQAGWEHVRGFDNSEAAALTYRHNIGSVYVWDMTIMLTHETDIDLVVGGPPCQGFSAQNKNHEGDERKNHVVTFALIVAENRPRAFLMENVVSLLGKRGQNVLESFRSVLKGYFIEAVVLSALNFGLAQDRTRAFIYGFRDQAPTSKPGPGWCRELRTIQDAIGDLPEPPEDGSPHPDYFNHYRHEISPENLERIKHVPPGGGRKDLPPHLQLPCHRKVITGGGGWPEVFGRLKWTRQAQTLTTNFHTCTKGRHVHPSADRCLTPREAARLQGFPDEFEFLGNRTEVRTQIGNAVPPRMAGFMGKFIKGELE